MTAAATRYVLVQYAVRTRYARSASRPREPVGSLVAPVRPVHALRSPAGGLDLRAFVPLVVARDRDAIGLRRDRRAPHAVIRLPRAAAPHALVRRCATRVVARPHRRGTRDAGLRGPRAKACEGAAAHGVDVVRIDAVEAGRGRTRRVTCLRVELDRRELRRELQPRGVGDQAVEGVVDVDAADAELAEIFEVCLDDGARPLPLLVRLEVHGDVEPVLPRRSHEGRQPVGLG